jgi:hypothetical protein
VSEVFHSGETQIPNPLTPVGNKRRELAVRTAALAGVGLLLSLVGGASASAAGFQGAIPAMALNSVLALGALGLALQMFLQSRRDTRPVVLPPTVPGDYAGGDLANALHDRVLEAYTLPDGLLRRLQRRWGSNPLFATRESQVVAEASLNFILLGTLAIVGFALILMPISWVAGTPLAVTVGIVWCLGATILIGRHLVFRWRLVRQLVAETSPQCQPEERLGSVHGGGDPFLLYADLEQRLLEIRNNRVPNRTLHKAGWDGTAAHIAETGRFEGELLVENQPLSAPRPLPQAVGALLREGEVPFLAGVALLSFYVPGTPVLTSLAAAAVGACLLFVGHRALADAERLSRKHRWESTALLLMAEGTTGKAQLRAGRGVDDSFESTNTVIRSDGKFRWYAGKVVSENTSLAGQRLVVAVRHDADSHRVLELTEAALEAFRNKGVRLQQIDFQDKSVENVLKANVLAVKAQSAARLEVAAPQGRAELKNGASETVSLGFCTGCGQPRDSAKARFCGACGVAYTL